MTGQYENGANGCALLVFPLPNDPSLVGVNAFVQEIVRRFDFTAGVQVSLL